MARYEDYVKKDQLEDEIVEAENQEQVRESNSDIPDRFKGKSPEEIARAYAELEKLNSRQAQDLGAMRKTVDTLLELKSDTTSILQEQKREEPPVPVTADDLYTNPDENIRRVAREETAGQVKSLNKEVVELQRQLALEAFTRDHPGWRETAASPEFQNWVAESPYRTRMLIAADKYDLDAADALLSLYGDMQGRKNQEAEEKARKQEERQRDLKRASLESSGPISHDSVQTFSRQDLLNRRLAAKRGDQSAEQWLRVNAVAIREAYEDKRITD